MTIDAQTAAQIRRLYFAEHFRVHTISTALAVHHETVERVLGLKDRKKPEPRPKALDSYRDFLQEQLQRYPRLRATRLFDMIRARGYEGSPRSVRTYVHELRPRGQAPAFLHCNPLCAEQAQVDWAQVGSVPVPGGRRPLWVFVQVLAFSRALYAELVFDQTVPSLGRSLLRAAQFFGGLPRQYLFDNPKTVVLARSGNQVRFQPELLDLCTKLLVEPRLCAVYAPQQKGRVERSVRYLRDRFFEGRVLSDRDQGNQDLWTFLRTLAPQRPHPDFKDRTVQQVFEEQERPQLLPLPAVLPPVELCIPVHLDKYAHFQFDSNRYSVPARYAQRTLTLLADEQHLRLLDRDQEVARHPRCWGRHQRCSLPQHQQQTLAHLLTGFGQTGDDPTVVADYNGDGKDDIAVYRAGASAGAQSTWYFRTTANGPVTFVPWGQNGDFPAPGDYDGNGKADFMIQRNAGGGQAGFWRLSDAFVAQPVVIFGTPTDVIVPGDYDGDGKTDAGVYRPSNFNWFVNRSTAGILIQQFGQTGDIPLENTFVR